MGETGLSKAIAEIQVWNRFGKKEIVSLFPKFITIRSANQIFDSDVTILPIHAISHLSIRHHSIVALVVGCGVTFAISGGAVCLLTDQKEIGFGIIGLAVVGTIAVLLFGGVRSTTLSIAVPTLARELRILGHLALHSNTDSFLASFVDAFK